VRAQAMAGCGWPCINLNRKFSTLQVSGAVHLGLYIVGAWDGPMYYVLRSSFSMLIGVLLVVYTSYFILQEHN